jgi:membrane-associated phospholipid phosphatase
VRAAPRLLLWLGGAVLFALLTALVYSEAGLGVDRALLAALAPIRCPAATSVVLALTQLGSTEALTLVALAAVGTLLYERAWRPALYVALVAIGAALLNTGLKILFARTRPELALVAAHGFAFPSGHSMGAAAIYGALAIVLVDRRASARTALVGGAAALVALIGFTRMYLGVHFPTDVVAGWALGASAAWWLHPIAIRRAAAA